MSIDYINAQYQFLTEKLDSLIKAGKIQSARGLAEEIRTIEQVLRYDYCTYPKP